MKLLNYIREMFDRHPYEYAVPVGMYLWRVHKVTKAVQLSGDKPDDWTFVVLRATNDIKYILSFKISLKEARERYPNADF